MKKGNHIKRPTLSLLRGCTSYADVKKDISEYLEKSSKVSEKQLMELKLQLAKCECNLGLMSRAEPYLDKCEEYILSNGKEEEIALCYNVRSLLHLMKGDHQSGIECALKSLEIFEKLEMSFWVSDTCVNCGHLCARMGLYNEAMDYLSRAYSMAVQSEDKITAAIIGVNLNEVMMTAMPPADCIRSNQELLVLIKDAYGGTPSYTEAYTYLQLAYNYFTAGDISHAEIYADKALDMANSLKHFASHELIFTNVYSVKSDIAAVRGDEQALLKHSEQCIKAAIAAQDTNSRQEILVILFKFYLEKKDITKAKKYLDEAAELLQANDRGLMYDRINKYYCEYYEAIGDGTSELRYFKLVYEYKTNQQNEVQTNRVSYMKKMYQLEMTKNEVSRQKVELDFKTQELNMTTYHLNQRNQLLNDLKENISELKKTKSKADVIFNTISHRIDQAFVKEEVEKERFRDKFDEANRGFIAKLYQAYPDLSPTECRICSLLRSGFSSKEIGNLLSTSNRNIENHRVHIRAKMKLTRRDNLNMILTEIK